MLLAVLLPLLLCRLQQALLPEQLLLVLLVPCPLAVLLRRGALSA
jgi:hypothetical protein